MTVKRATLATRVSQGSDICVLARVALECAIRDETDLIALLPEPSRMPPIKPMRAVTVALGIIGDVGFWGRSRRHLLGLSFAAFDPERS